MLILREVLCWQASEVAELLDTTVASVTSALQRARATLGATRADDAASAADLGAAAQALLARYVAAFEAYDIDGLVSLLSEDASISMPPLALWLEGLDDLRGWYLGHGIGCKGSRLVPTVANGMPAFGQYRSDGNGGHAPWSLQVLEIADGRIQHVHHFLDTAGCSRASACRPCPDRPAGRPGRSAPAARAAPARVAYAQVGGASQRVEPQPGERVHGGQVRRRRRGHHTTPAVRVAHLDACHAAPPGPPLQRRRPPDRQLIGRGAGGRHQRPGEQPAQVRVPPALR
ncbi:MAG: polymerase sigma70 factor, partial [Frankiales bacterium]|nr:polymerase sigma70 factor [Frankiales bacterium]